MRPRFSNFQKLQTEWCLLIDGKNPSTNKTYNPRPNYDAENLAWWYEAESIHDGDTTRNLAYLISYLEMFGPRLPMKGLAVHEGWVYPDRAVMRSLHAAGTLVVDDKVFVLTESGHALIANFLVQDGNHFHRVSGTDQKG